MNGIKNKNMKNKILNEVYKNSNDEVKEILRGKFSNQELGIETVVNQEEFNQFFREILAKYKKNVRFDWGFSNYEIFDENGDWLFHVNYNPENKHFWYSKCRTLPLFEEKFGVNTQELNELMIPVMEQDFKLVGVTPFLFSLHFKRCNGARLQISGSYTKNVYILK